MPIRICEIFHSRQGEGLLTGTPSVFVRTSGCNLACAFCDTRYASIEPEGRFMTVADIFDEITRNGYPIDHLVLTGGEPMLWEDVTELTAQFRRRGSHITIETNGTIFRKLECDLMSISPKMSNSVPGVRTEPGCNHIGTDCNHTESGCNHTNYSQTETTHDRLRFNPRAMADLLGNYSCQVKFVVRTEADLAEIDQYCRLFPELNSDLNSDLKPEPGDRFAQVLFMPQGQTPEEVAEVEQWLLPWTEQHHRRYCPRMHLVWYGNRRGF